MIKDNYISNIINEIKEVLEKNDYRKERYGKDIEWFQERNNIYENNIIRVAIMGITSSGKSTLVNAILGEKILPMAIRPSSSIIITASKGKNRQATIYFEDRGPQILKDDSLNEETIKRYADESKNPNNKLKVTQIDITTPYFILDENIHIIDSPGLDAWNLEGHEKLTLEILLPTIDICVFVTTVKANSDKTNAEKIKIVSEKEKQIVLVQNMIDSVEEKIGKDGVIEEDKVTILRKHKKRAEKLLKEVTKNTEAFEVTQISALNGLKGIINKDDELYRKSNFNAFIKSIEICVENTIPKLNSQRAVGLIEKINNIIITDREIVNGKDLDSIESLIKIKKIDIDELVRTFERAQENIYLKIKAIEEIISETITEIVNTPSEEVRDYFDIIDRINNKNLYVESDILNIVKQLEKEKKKIYNNLNLDTRISYALPIAESKNIEIKHKYEERTMLFKKEGVLNKGKRLLSNIFDREWGYKEVGYDEKIVDKDATIQMAQNICEQNKIRYISILKEWSNQYRKAIVVFYDEVIKREDEYEEKKNQNLEIYDIDEVSKSLEIIKNKFNISKIIERNEAEDIIDTYEKNLLYPISKANYNLYRLSNRIFEDNYLLVGKYIRQKSMEKTQQNISELFWTWDIDSCKEFVLKIYGVYLDKKQCEFIKKEGIYKFQNIIIIYESSENNTELFEKLVEIKNKIYNTFIIFNGVQIGNSKKKILESRNLSYFLKNNNLFINLVIDSSREFINANNIQELLLEVHNLKNSIIDKFHNIRTKFILINSKNPIYNMALIEVQEKDEFIISQYKEVKERLFENSLSRGTEEKEVLEAILSYFLNSSRSLRKHEGV